MIDLRIVDAHTGVGWLEDDFHHFGVTITHDQGEVTGVRMAATRTPWITCPGAAEPLQALVGKPLVARATDVGALIEMRLQCTHVFDLTGLLLAHIANTDTRQPHRRYHVIVPDRERFGGIDHLSSFGPGTATLLQDGETVMYWEVDGDMITGPEPYGGHSQSVGFRAWTEAMPLEEAEHASILRRFLLVAGGRTVLHDEYPTAASQHVPPVCHTYQPERSEQALRILGNTWDYSDRPGDLLLNVAEVP
jgi:hypothetical protein